MNGVYNTKAKAMTEITQAKAMTEITQAIAAQWRELDEKDKKRYMNMWKMDKKWYDKEMKGYKPSSASYDEEPKKKGKGKKKEESSSSEDESSEESEKPKKKIKGKK